MKVVPFPKQVNEALIEDLEELLERAREGELVDIAYIGGCADGTMCTGFTETTDNYRRMAGVSQLLYRLNQRMEEHS